MRRSPSTSCSKNQNAAEMKFCAGVFLPETEKIADVRVEQKIAGK